MHKETSFLKKEEAEKKWLLVDAENKPLGRLASRIAVILMGKDSARFTPNYPSGNFVVVVNAAKVRLTGKKLEKKIYYQHSFYPGGLKTINAKSLLNKHPEALLEKAVMGMLPKNKLRKVLMKKLKIYAGTEHPHKAQKPEKMEFVA